MTSTDIMGVYPDNDMLVKEIGNYANSFKELFSQLDKWSKSGVRELVYNAKQETENMIEQSNFSVTILERLIDNCNKQFDKLSEELGHNVHECYQKETLNEIAQSKYEKILTRKNGMDFSLNLVKSKFILFNNWYKKTFEEEYVLRSVKKTRSEVSAQSNLGKIKKFNATQMNFRFKPVTSI